LVSPRRCLRVLILVAMLVPLACGSGDDADESSVGDGDARPSLPTAVTTSGAGATAMLNGELFVVDRTLPAGALSAERLESVGEADSAGERFTLARARSDDVEPWERVSAAPDGWRVWQPVPVLNVIDQAGAGATIVDVEAAEFPDACLGAAEPGEVCAAVITAGYRVIVEQSGTRTEYRVDLGGNVRRIA
jgi:hypothetical protein